MAVQRIDAHLDLRKNQLLNAIVQPLSAAPGSPVEGQIYYDTTAHQFGVYQGSSWVYLAAGGTDTEAVQDVVAGLLTPGTVITASYNDAANTLTLSIGSGQVTNVMLASGISADKLVDGTTNGVYTLSERTKLAGIATGATVYTNAMALANRLDQFASPTAAVSLNSQRVTNVLDPTSAQDAATKNYADTQQTAANTANRARANHTGTQTASTISDFDTQVRTSRLDQLAAPTAAVSFNGQRGTGAADPISGSDLVTKQYADGLRQGISVKDPVLLATTGNVSLTGEQTIDGTLTSGSRVLVKNQTTASQNGIYTTASGAWVRASDADAATELPEGTTVWVQSGTANGNTRWVMTTSGAITLGTTSLSFTQDFAATATTAGAGLTAAGNAFSVGAGTGVTVGADTVGIDTAVVVRKFAQTIGDGATTAFALSHGLATQDVTVAIRDTSTNELVLAQVVATSSSVVTVTFNTAPAANAYRVTIHG